MYFTNNRLEKILVFFYSLSLSLAQTESSQATQVSQKLLHTKGGCKLDHLIIEKITKPVLDIILQPEMIFEPEIVTETVIVTSETNYINFSSFYSQVCYNVLSDRRHSSLSQSSHSDASRSSSEYYANYSAIQSEVSFVLSLEHQSLESSYSSLYLEQSNSLSSISDHSYSSYSSNSEYEIDSKSVHESSESSKDAYSSISSSESAMLNLPNDTDKSVSRIVTDSAESNKTVKKTPLQPKISNKNVSKESYKKFRMAEKVFEIIAKHIVNPATY